MLQNKQVEILLIMKQIFQSRRNTLHDRNALGQTRIVSCTLTSCITTDSRFWLLELFSGIWFQKEAKKKDLTIQEGSHLLVLVCSNFMKSGHIFFS